MSSRWSGVVPLVLALIAPPPAHAADPSIAEADPVLSALIEESIARSPEIKAVEQAVEAARTRPAQAGALPDPMLSASYTNDGWSPSLGQEQMTTLGVMWSQTLPAPGKRGLRAGVARREAERSETQVQRARLGLIAEVKRAYYATLLARDLSALGKEQEAAWSQVEQSARARYEVGAGAQQDVFRAQVERTRVQQLVIEAEADAAMQRAALARLLNRPSAEVPKLEGSLELRPIPSSTEDLVALAERESPELRASGLAIERDRLGASLARKEFRPDFTLQAGYMNRGELAPMWQAGVGVTLPIYRKRLHASVGEAGAQLASSERWVEATRLLLRQRTEERLAQLEAAARIAELYREGVLPQGQMALEASLANYESGRIPFVAVLESLTSLYRDRASYLQQVAGHESLKAGLYEWSLEPGAMRPNMAPMPMAAPSMSMAGGTGMGASGGMRNGAMDEKSGGMRGSMGSR